MHQDTQSQQTARRFSPAEICQRNHFSLTTFYKLLKEGRLRAYKQGRNTIVTEEDEEVYRASLPAYAPNGR